MASREQFVYVSLLDGNKLNQIQDMNAIDSFGKS